MLMPILVFEFFTTDPIEKKLKLEKLKSRPDIMKKVEQIYNNLKQRYPDAKIDKEDVINAVIDIPWLLTMTDQGKSPIKSIKEHFMLEQVVRGTAVPTLPSVNTISGNLGFYRRQIGLRPGLTANPNYLTRTVRPPQTIVRTLGSPIIRAYDTRTADEKRLHMRLVTHRNYTKGELPGQFGSRPTVMTRRPVGRITPTKYVGTQRAIPPEQQ